MRRNPIISPMTINTNPVNDPSFFSLLELDLNNSCLEPGWYVMLLLLHMQVPPCLFHAFSCLPKKSGRVSCRLPTVWFCEVCSCGVTSHAFSENWVWSEGMIRFGVFVSFCFGRRKTCEVVLVFLQQGHICLIISYAVISALTVA